MEYHKEHPNLIYQQLGDIFRITKARVHQIIRRGSQQRINEKEEDHALKIP